MASGMSKSREFNPCHTEVLDFAEVECERFVSEIVAQTAEPG